jgi:hypothetical protein
VLDSSYFYIFVALVKLRENNILAFEWLTMSATCMRFPDVGRTSKITVISDNARQSNTRPR